MEYVEGKRWKIENWLYASEVTSIWNKKSTHCFFVKSKRKPFPRRESPDNPQNLDEEETTETVAIPHDDEKENEVCSNIIICYRTCRLLKPKIHLIISIFYRGSTLKNNCYFVISLNLVFSNNFSGKSSSIFRFQNAKSVHKYTHNSYFLRWRQYYV